MRFANHLIGFLFFVVIIKMFPNEILIEIKRTIGYRERGEFEDVERGSETRHELNKLHVMCLRVCLVGNKYGNILTRSMRTTFIFQTVAA